jgi:pimeloyl-ACP methyl ester carboxylesterase
MATDHTPVGLEVADLRQGRIAYRAMGPAATSSPPVVFVHGVLVDGRLWQPVAERLAGQGIRSYAPTLPLGAHRWPMNPDADLSPRGIAQLMLDFIEALGLSDVTIVGNDTGGAICQVMLGADTSRIGAAVLTDCDAFDSFPPRALAPLFQAMRHPAVVAAMVPGLRLDAVRQGRLAYGPLTSTPIDRGLTRDWVQPLASKDIRRDLARFARGVQPGVLLDAASRFSQFTGPVRILWGEDDAFFSIELGDQLREAFPGATLSTVAAGRTFLPLDHPGEVAREITAATRDTARR